MKLRDGSTYFLSDAFFDAYPNDLYPEIEAKRGRPYAFYLIELQDGVWFAIPLRRHVSHPFVFRTSDSGGLDYSKAIPIFDIRYVDTSRRAFVRKEEYPLMQRSVGAIKDGLRDYLAHYKQARKHPERTRNATLIRYSTLQYFEDELGLV